MRKITIFLLSMIFIAMLMIPGVAAGETQITITPDKTTAYRGDTIKFTVSISGDNTCTSVGLALNFDTKVFELVEGKANASNAAVNSFNLSQKLFAVRYNEATKPSGQIGYFVLKVKSDAAFAATSISGTAAVNNVSTNVASSVKAAKVTVACEHKYGDWVSADGTNHKRTCSICGNSETKKHSYSNDCDTKCNSCDYKRSTEHKYSNTLSANAEYHYYECSGCGKQKDAQAHTPGDPATEEHAQTCTVCGYEIAPKLEHVHQQIGDIQISDTHHWYACQTCDGQAAYEEHVYAFACSSVCSTCGYKREVTHTLAEGDALKWEFDETGHWYPCAVCGEQVEFAEHISDEDPVDPSCTVCGGPLAHVHSFTEEWTSDGKTHWHECACGEREGETEHTWDTGVITKEPEGESYGEMVFTCTICGEEDAAVVVGTGLPFDLPPLWVLCIIAGGAALLILGPTTFMIVVLVKMGKKSKGKFSDK